MVGFRALDLVTLFVTACYLVVWLEVWFHFTPVLASVRAPVRALVGDPIHSGICWRTLLENTFGDPICLVPGILRVDTRLTMPKGKKRRIEDNIQIWLKEPSDEHALLINVDEDYLIGNLVNDLVKWENFSFEGDNPKHIRVQHCGKDVQRGVPLASIKTSDNNPLVVSIDHNLYGELLKKFNVRPSGQKDKGIIKFLIDKIAPYAEFIALGNDLEEALPL